MPKAEFSISISTDRNWWVAVADQRSASKLDPAYILIMANDTAVTIGGDYNDLQRIADEINSFLAKREEKLGIYNPRRV